MIHRGYDLFITDPGEKDEQLCLVCGKKCNVARSVIGPTSFASALAKHSEEHDEFTCPHIDQAWHQKALRLVQLIEETPSKRLAEIMHLDLKDLLAENLEN